MSPGDLFEHITLGEVAEQCPAGGTHTYREMPCELDTGGSPAGDYCVECGAPAPLPEAEADR